MRWNSCIPEAFILLILLLSPFYLKELWFMTVILSITPFFCLSLSILVTCFAPTDSLFLFVVKDAKGSNEKDQSPTIPAFATGWKIYIVLRSSFLSNNKSYSCIIFRPFRLVFFLVVDRPRYNNHNKFFLFLFFLD